MTVLRAQVCPDGMCSFFLSAYYWFLLHAFRASLCLAGSTAHVNTSLTLYLQSKLGRGGGLSEQGVLRAQCSDARTHLLHQGVARHSIALLIALALVPHVLHAHNALRHATRNLLTALAA